MFIVAALIEQNRLEPARPMAPEREAAHREKEGRIATLLLSPVPSASCMGDLGISPTGHRTGLPPTGPKYLGENPKNKEPHVLKFALCVCGIKPSTPFLGSVIVCGIYRSPGSAQGVHKVCFQLEPVPRRQISCGTAGVVTCVFALAYPSDEIGIRPHMKGKGTRLRRFGGMRTREGREGRQGRWPPARASVGATE